MVKNNNIFNSIIGDIMEYIEKREGYGQLLSDMEEMELYSESVEDAIREEILQCATKISTFIYECYKLSEYKAETNTNNINYFLVDENNELIEFPAPIPIDFFQKLVKEGINISYEEDSVSTITE